jgi:hypothetical protein
MSFSAEQHVGTRDVQRVTVKGGQWTAVGDFVSAPDRG